MTIFGTRPEAIKMAPLVKELEKREEIEKDKKNSEDSFGRIYIRDKYVDEDDDDKKKFCEILIIIDDIKWLIDGF